MPKRKDIKEQPIFKRGRKTLRGDMERGVQHWARNVEKSREKRFGKSTAGTWQQWLMVIGVALIVVTIAAHAHLGETAITLLIVFGFVIALPELRIMLNIERRRGKTKEAEGELDNHIREALRKMDAIGGSFTDEESANQQLCILLRELVPGANVSLVRQGSGSMGDIRMGNTIIEGKLDLVTKDEMDRLVGQLQDYCSRSSSQIKVVVYGELRPDFRSRIQNLPEYYSRILLHHLEHPQKGRRKSGKEQWTVYRQKASEDESFASDG